MFSLSAKIKSVCGEYEFWYWMVGVKFYHEIRHKSFFC